jgi:hypothetical protein
MHVVEVRRPLAQILESQNGYVCVYGAGNFRGFRDTWITLCPPVIIRTDHQPHKGFVLGRSERLVPLGLLAFVKSTAMMTEYAA